MPSYLLARLWPRRPDRRSRFKSYPAKQDQDQKNDNNKAKPATAIISGAVERTASKASETSQQDDNQNYEKYDANRQGMISKFLSDHTTRSCGFRRSFSVRQ